MFDHKASRPCTRQVFRNRFGFQNLEPKGGVRHEDDERIAIVASIKSSLLKAQKFKL